MKPINILLFLLLMVSPFVTQAGQWTEVAEITRIYAKSSGIVSVRFNITPSNPDSCTYTDFYELQQDNNGFDQIYTLILAARHSDSGVRLYIDGCSNANRVKILHAMEHE